MAPVTGSGPSELDSFFADVNTVQSHLATVKENVARINALTKARLVEVDRAKESKSGDELQGASRRVCWWARH